METLPIGTEVDPLGELIKGGFAEEREESRANPHHDKLGRFASKSGYNPGKWERHSGRDAMVADIENSLKSGVSPEQQALNVKRDGPDWAKKKAEFLASGLGADTTVSYKNGPHSIQFTGTQVSDSDQKRFLNEFDRLQSKYPVDKDVHISVDPESSFGRGVGGETTPGTGHIRVNEKSLNEKTWSGMPASADVTSSQYVLAHEWGHVVSTPEEAKNKSVHREAIDVGGLTRYGIAGADGVLAPAEGYAESFAEWSLTDGTTDNAAAKVYAKKFGWGEKFGTD